MKVNPRLAAGAALALLLLAPYATPAAAQKEKGRREKTASAKTEAVGQLEPGLGGDSPQDAPDEMQAHRREQAREDAEGLVPYYNNFLTSYRLGPEDVISITVFGLDRYSKAGIVVPPDGRIDYFFIKEGLLVAGKTTREVAEEIARHLDEYIIDPKVTVSLEKAMSARFGVIGDVARPGIMVMSRRMSVYEALNEAGGVLPTGDKKKVIVLRWGPDRTMQRVLVNVAAIERGQAPDSYFLRPGDQVFVPGNRYKTVKEILNILPVINFMRIFTGGW